MSKLNFEENAFVVCILRAILIVNLCLADEIWSNLH